jgi:hypothetical protein
MTLDEKADGAPATVIAQLPKYRAAMIDHAPAKPWTRSETLALATHQCSQCHGLGMRGGLDDSKKPCNCVLRAIFRACFARFARCNSQDRRIGRANFETRPGQHQHGSWGRPDEEYLADFCIVSKRYLSAPEYRIFKYHFLLGASWRLCCQKLKTDKGAFFHSVYRIEQRLGRIFRDLQPYALYPLDDYFHATRAESVSKAAPRRAA